MKFDVSRKFLRKLAAYGEIAYFAMGDSEATVNRWKAAYLFSGILDYFVLLTIEALDNGELAEHLVGIYREISEERIDVPYFYRALEGILSLRFEVSAKPEVDFSIDVAERRAKKVLNHVNLDDALEKAMVCRQLRKAVKAEEESRQENGRDDNVMWG